MKMPILPLLSIAQASFRGNMVKLLVYPAPAEYNRRFPTRANVDLTTVTKG